MWKLVPTDFRNEISILNVNQWVSFALVPDLKINFRSFFFPAKISIDLFGQQRPGHGFLCNTVRHSSVSEELLALWRIGLSDPGKLVIFYFIHCSIHNSRTSEV